MDINFACYLVYFVQSVREVSEKAENWRTSR